MSKVPGIVRSLLWKKANANQWLLEQEDLECTKKTQDCEKPENPGAKIWRYMDLAKFLSLIDTRRLYFCQIDSLNDSFEGSLLPSRLLNRSEENSAKLFAEKMRSYYPQVKVNCWHIAENESAAMWKLYTEANAGIAVQSTFSRLCESLMGCSIEVRIGKV